MKEKLRIIIEDNTSQKGKVFDYFIQILILLLMYSTHSHQKTELDQQELIKYTKKKQWKEHLRKFKDL